MTKNHFDQSHIEKKYFIDGHRYNCPYCNIRNVQYQVVRSGEFNWSRDTNCYFYLVRCSHCSNISLHLSKYDALLGNSGSFRFPPIHLIENAQVTNIEARISIGEKLTEELDEIFFFHQPTSFFTIDNRIPKNIRGLLSEADGCRKMDHLVGASGCLRKAIYELLEAQGIPKEEASTPKPIELGYNKRIKLLKNKFPNIDSEYFDILANIQGMTSDTLHEGSWDTFDSPALTLLIETTKEILYEIYVLCSAFILSKRSVRSMVWRSADFSTASITSSRN